MIVLDLTILGFVRRCKSMYTDIEMLWHEFQLTTFVAPFILFCCLANPHRSRFEVAS